MDEPHGWLIERLDTNAWFSIEPGPLYGRLADSWTKCSVLALRFARRIDAENAIRWLTIPADWFAVAATEHTWSDRAAPAPTIAIPSPPQENSETK